MFFLREIGRKLERVAAGSTRGDADSKTADFACSGQIALEEGGRKIAYCDVIETVAGFIGGKQRRDVDLEGEQVADRIAILGAIQAAEGVGAPGVRIGGGRAIERGLQGGDERFVSGFIGSRSTNGRHVAGAKFANHLLPFARMK